MEAEAAAGRGPGLEAEVEWAQGVEAAPAAEVAILIPR